MWRKREIGRKGPYWVEHGSMGVGGASMSMSGSYLGGRPGGVTVTARILCMGASVMGVRGTFPPHPCTILLRPCSVQMVVLCIFIPGTPV